VGTGLLEVRDSWKVLPVRGPVPGRSALLAAPPSSLLRPPDLRVESTWIRPNTSRRQSVAGDSNALRRLAVRTSASICITSARVFERCTSLEVMYRVVIRYLAWGAEMLLHRVAWARPCCYTGQQMSSSAFCTTALSGIYPDLA